MKKLNLLLTVAALLLVTAVSAQVPANDECATAIPLNAPDCQPTIYTNVNATTSVIGTDNNPTCFNGGNPSNDVWFSFTCPDTLTDLRLTLKFNAS